MKLAMIALGRMDGNMVKRLAIPVYHSPKPPEERVNMTLKALNHHRRYLILATGASKSSALQAIRDGRLLPVSRITNAEWVVDLAVCS